MTDPRITRNSVLSAIYDRKNRRRTVWSPSSTLVVMRIERYPHEPVDNLRRMKRLLKQLCDDGLLIRRPELQTLFTLSEIAYGRMADVKLPRNEPSP